AGGRGYRHRHPAARAGARARTLHAGREPADAQAHRHRPRLAAVQGPGGAAWRDAGAVERRRPGHDRDRRVSASAGRATGRRDGRHDIVGRLGGRPRALCESIAISVNTLLRVVELPYDAFADPRHRPSTTVLPENPAGPRDWLSRMAPSTTTPLSAMRTAA